MRLEFCRKSALALRSLPAADRSIADQRQSSITYTPARLYPGSLGRCIVTP